VQHSETEKRNVSVPGGRVCALSTVAPGIELSSIAVRRRRAFVLMAVNRQAFLVFPPLDRAHVAPQVRSDFLPRLEPTSARILA
jgi:hypothetical protein